MSEPKTAPSGLDTATGQLNAIMIPPKLVSSEGMQNAKKVNPSPRLKTLIELAREEFKRLESTSEEFYSALANPPSLELSEAEVDTIMEELGSTKELSGAWLPVTIKTGNEYYRIWGKTAYCG